MKAFEQVSNFLSGFNIGSRNAYKRSLKLLIDYACDLGLGDEESIDFSKLIPVVGSDGVVVYHASIDPLFIRDFLSYRKRTGDTQRTLAKHLMHFRMFFRYLYDHKYLVINPIDSIESIRWPIAKETPYLSEEECILLLISAIESDFPERNFAMIKLWLTTGLRPKELRCLQIGDIDFYRKKVYVNRWQKTGKFRVLELYDQVAEDLKYYLGCEERQDDVKELFQNQGESFTEHQLRNLIKSLIEKAGIDKPVTPRGLRHSYATVLSNAGMNIYVLQQMLSHIKLTTTRIYTHGNNIKFDPQLYPNAKLISGFIRSRYIEIN